MGFTTKGRYGEHCEYGDDADVANVVDQLVGELETEIHDEPDDEHTQIAVTHGNWSLTVYLCGIFALDDLSWITEEGRFQSMIDLRMRVVSREQACDLLEKMARGNIEAVRQEDWVTLEELEPSEGHCFRDSNPQQSRRERGWEIVEESLPDPEEVRRHAADAQRYGEKLVVAREAAITKLRDSDSDFATLLESTQVFAGFEGSLLKYSFLYVPATVDCEEIHVAFDWKQIEALTDRELVAELIDRVRGRTTAMEFSATSTDNDFEEP